MTIDITETTLSTTIQTTVSTIVPIVILSFIGVSSLTTAKKVSEDIYIQYISKQNNTKKAESDVPIFN